MRHPKFPTMTRRTALALLGAAASIPLTGARAIEQILHPYPEGYGTDPNLIDPVVPWSGIMSEKQLQMVAYFADFILPAEGRAPSASTLGIHDFINEWVSAPYPEQVKDRTTILDGLTWLDTEATARFGADFLSTSNENRDNILKAAATENNPDDPAPHAFFVRLRALVAGGYYTTQEGFHDIGYIGNIPLETFPGPSPSVKEALEEQFKKLGI
ncbi:gluconate 2-dehydrogenase subunit 3 family protein [Kordiimonas sp.]|uniref:gluconate 2-dehydrogenase subunit 3 family protein n=1 Tax=Kordiimonas sp. TaxID=1970157 RepID=UPI003A904D4F